jgi:hypothetical protein
MPSRPKKCIVLAAALWLVVFAQRATAETCWAYSDSDNAKVPIQCIAKSDLTSACSWPTDCTTVQASSPQTILEMHKTWHECFGNVGGNAPPLDWCPNTNMPYGTDPVMVVRAR